MQTSNISRRIARFLTITLASCIVFVASMAVFHVVLEDGFSFTRNSPLPEYLLETPAYSQNISKEQEAVASPMDIMLAAAFENEFYMPLGSEIVLRDDAPAASTMVANSQEITPASAQCALVKRTGPGVQAGALAMNCAGVDVR